MGRQPRWRWAPTVVVLQLLLLLLAVSVGRATGAACSMDVVGHKYERFVQKQLQLRAAAARKEGDRVRDIMEETKPAPIRIKLIPQLEGTFMDAANQKRLVEQLAPGAINILHKYIEVRLPRKYSIRMPRPANDSKDGLCNDAYAAALWEGGGVRGHDLVLFLTANHTKDCKQGALAYTLPCLTDLVTGRPIAAGMNVCPLSLNSAPHRLLHTLVHEMVHALGFSGQLFPLFYDSKTWNPYKRADQVAIDYEGPANRSSGAQPSSMYIAFPALKALAQEHFGCPSLPGAPADVPSYASHFKQRVMGHELMMPATSEDGQGKEMTAFTLTLLEATGWYRSRMDLAMPMVFGKNAGCSLLKDTCANFMRTNPAQNLYCPVERKDTDQCTFDYKGIGVCVEGVDDSCYLSGASVLRGATLTCGSTSSWSTMRHQAFFFHHTQAGGTVGSHTARCFPVDPATKVCQRPPGSRSSTSSSSKGDDTPCLMRQGMCLETACDAAGKLSAVFRFPDGTTTKLPCPTGGTVDLATALPGRGFVSGILRCPQNDVVCPQLGCKVACVNGQCHNGRCVCAMAFTGERCEKSLVPGWT